MSQLTLSGWGRVKETSRATNESDSPTAFFLSPPNNRMLSYPEALEFAITTVTKLPLGMTLTSQELFEGVRLRGDKRVRGAIIQHLRRLGLLRAVGYTQRGQTNRNNGWAWEWEVSNDGN